LTIGEYKKGNVKVEIANYFSLDHRNPWDKTFQQEYI